MVNVTPLPGPGDPGFAESFCEHGRQAIDGHENCWRPSGRTVSHVCPRLNKPVSFVAYSQRPLCEMCGRVLGSRVDSDDGGNE